ncbi:hypothetical protein HMPREF9069_01282 [Atopobium sp. oral taxon 810 str. F0209]|nr:hypothetical protein HMPREF9069_01282 [Atopobium sp. oral taxon 810 str. F0209]
MPQPMQSSETDAFMINPLTFALEPLIQALLHFYTFVRVRLVVFVRTHVTGRDTTSKMKTTLELN